MRVAADAYGVFRPLILMPRRGSPMIAAARQVAMYLANCTAGVPVARLAGAFKRDVSTITHDIRKIEDMRDDPDFDEMISHLEAVFHGENSHNQA